MLITIDNNLNWTEHIEILKTKILKPIAILYIRRAIGCINFKNWKENGSKIEITRKYQILKICSNMTLEFFCTNSREIYYQANLNLTLKTIINKYKITIFLEQTIFSQIKQSLWSKFIILSW